MDISKIMISFILSIVFITTGCAPGKAETGPKVPSFRDYYPVLLKEAQKWQPDAYLDEAEIFLAPRFSDSTSISAGFYSPSANSESFGVEIQQDGNLSSRTFDHSSPILNHKPITLNDWKIDSQAALDALLKEIGSKSLNAEGNHCSSISLRRILPSPDQRIIWSLRLWNCSSPAEYFYLDANSGILLDISVINIQPTRFPTGKP
jgi:hypothetical protein